VIGERGNNAALAASVAAFQLALEVLTRERDQMRWALTQNNLGNTLRVMGERGDDAALAGSVAAYRSALEVKTRERDPAGWALTQMNLGIALRVMGDRHNSPNDKRAAYRAGIEAEMAALSIFRAETYPAYYERASQALALLQARLASLVPTVVR